MIIEDRTGCFAILILSRSIHTNCSSRSVALPRSTAGFPTLSAAVILLSLLPVSLALGESNNLSLIAFCPPVRKQKKDVVLTDLSVMVPSWRRLNPVPHSCSSLRTILCGLATSMNQLLVFRTIAGAGGGGLAVVGSVIVSDLVPLKQRGLYQGCKHPYLLGFTFRHTLL